MATFKKTLGLTLLLTTLPSIAEEAAAPKVGLWDIRPVIQGVEEGKLAKAALEKEVEAARADLTKRQNELVQLNQSFQQKAASLNDQAKKQAQDEFQKKAMELKNAEMQYNMDMPRKQSEAAERIGLKATKIAEDLAKEKGLSAMYELSSGSITYMTNAENYTNEVISIYNKVHGTGSLKDGTAAAKPSETAKKG